MDNTVTEKSLLPTNGDDLFKHIVGVSPIYQSLADQQYVELSQEITNEINKDWAFFPQLRFATSQLFAGCILISGSTALLVNCVESYGRLKTVDSHHERRTTSGAHQSSFPKAVSKYGQITVCLTQDDSTTKLKIGAASCNLLVTSSTRLDKQTIANKTIETGANTSNFVPVPDTKIYMNAESLKLGRILLEDETATCIDQSYILYQLRQLRSKFYCMSTYSLCRSFSSIVSDITYRPYTIWTLCEYDSPQKIDSQSHKLSKVFQSIALLVLKNGSAAQIEVMIFQDLYSTLKDGTIKDTVEQIIKLQDNGSIEIINNMKLSNLLQILADFMTASINNSNQMASKLLSQNLYKK
ncbi:hypothetical protein BDC45DRAFT_519179 [Circinella umbellata]|nr:hypothetical protein BDC45DRAFT_519179 [Circinella umbellata]